MIESLSTYLRETGRALVMGEEEGMASGSGTGESGGKNATAYVQVRTTWCICNELFT